MNLRQKTALLLSTDLRSVARRLKEAQRTLDKAAASLAQVEEDHPWREATEASHRVGEAQGIIDSVLEDLVGRG